jgi:GNAT superfamily N-acetyltransferase
MNFNICEIKDRNKELIKQLVGIWEASVRSTHLFLSDDEILKIKEYVPEAIKGVQYLAVAKSENNLPLAFMSVNGNKLEMIFVSWNMIGCGIGRTLFEYGIKKYNINTLTVNEQNLQALEFYKHFGFKVFKRTELDEQSKPYPLLYMNI